MLAALFQMWLLLNNGRLRVDELWLSLSLTTHASYFINIIFAHSSIFFASSYLSVLYNSFFMDDSLIIIFDPF